MDYNELEIWLKGYLDAIQNGESVTKSQLELLISQIKEMINEIEENENEASLDDNDDLPF